MKVMFDSNVWQIILIPDNYPREPLLGDFKKIRKAIIENKIKAYLSETIFTIEAIKKSERQDFFGSVKLKITTTNKSTEELISCTISAGPNEKDAINFDERPILKKYFQEAIKLDFKIVYLPRLGGLVNPEVKNNRFNVSENELSIMYEVETKIANKGAGIKHIEEIGKKYNSNWFKGLKQAPESDRKKIYKAAAEWADGDSVASSIGIGCDYFCTRDEAKNAGDSSVLSRKNLAWLKKEYNFNTIFPEELANKI